MRVLHFTRVFPHVIIPLVNKLSNFAELHLMIPEGPQFDDFIGLEPEVVDRVSIKRFVDPPSTASPENIKLVHQLIKYVRKIKPDIIHIQAHGFDWFPFVIPFLRKTVLVNTVHDVQRHAGEYRLRSLFKMFFCVRYSDGIITHSNYVARKLIESHGVSKTKLNIVPFGIPLIFESSLSCNTPSPKTALFFGRMIEYKGLGILLEASDIVKSVDPNFRLIIAGRGKDLNIYRSEIKKRSYIDLIDKYISPQDLPNLFGRVLLVLQPYIEASQSGVTLLAYGFKKPVIVTKVGGMGEYVINGKTGLIINPHDKIGLAESIINLMSDEKRLLKMGIEAHNLISSIFSWQNISQKTYESYNRVLQ